MNITFGIVTSGMKESNVNTIIRSIEQQHIPTYEVLVVGPSQVKRKHTRVIHKPESEIHPIKTHLGWITRKKNIVAQEAAYDYIVFMHDYNVLDEGWYSGWCRFLEREGNFDIGVNYVFTKEGPRHVDWAVSPYDMWKLFPEFGINVQRRFDLQIPIQVKNLTKFQYISGGFWVATKEFSLKYPQIEEYGWGESEDVEWSKLIRGHTTFKFNPDASTRLIRDNKWAIQPFPERFLFQLMNYSDWLDENIPLWSVND